MFWCVSCYHFWSSCTTLVTFVLPVCIMCYLVQLSVFVHVLQLRHTSCVQVSVFISSCGCAGSFIIVSK